MKASHGSAMVLLNPLGTVSSEQIRQCAEAWLGTDYALMYWEWQYFRLPRRLLFEEYLGDAGGPPSDYKFYVIHQHVVFIEVDQGRFTDHTRDFFRPDWRPIESRIGPAPCASTPPARPRRLADMIATAETLARDTDFLRVDLYAIGDAIYFGELTHSPAAGNFGFADPTLDEQIGRTWRVPDRYV